MPHILLTQEEIFDDEKCEEIDEILIEQEDYECQYDYIFKFNDKLYVVYFKHHPEYGNTFFDEENDKIKCFEVEPIEKTIIEYKLKE